jgi:CheY-like chemotaxis protein
MASSTGSERLRDTVPRLRRYARAALGDRDRADDCVARAVAAASATGATASDLETALYHELYRRLADAPVAAPGDTGRQVEAQLLADDVRGLEPRRAHALLLRRLEGLDAGVAGAVMGLSPEEVDRLVGEAMAALRKRLLAKVLIIEDDTLVAEHIAAVLTGVGHAVTAIAASVEEALAAARTRRPDVVFADVELGGSASGIDAVAAIRDAGPVRTVYVTAYPERVLARGADAAATCLVTKPFDEARLRTAMAAALRDTPRATAG